MWALPDLITTTKLKRFGYQDEYRLAYTTTDAFAFESSLLDICRLHRFFTSSSTSYYPITPTNSLIPPPFSLPPLPYPHLRRCAPIFQPETIVLQGEAHIAERRRPC